MTRKPFDPENYKQNDEKACKWFVELATQIGFVVVADNNPRDGRTSLWDVQLKMPNSNATFSVDVEIKHNWEDCPFPFNTIHFPERKLKRYKIEPRFHVMFNTDGNRCVWVPRDLLLSSSVESCVPKNRDEIEGFPSPEVEDPSLIWFSKMGDTWKKAAVRAPVTIQLDLGDGQLVTMEEEY